MGELVEIKKEKSPGCDVSSDSESHYPYGTSLHFDDSDLVESLGLDKHSPGDELIVRATAVVTRKSEEADEKGTEHRVSIQLTSIALAKAPNNAAEELYGGGE